MPDYRSEVRERLRAARLAETVTVEIVEEMASHLGDVHRAALANGASEAEARLTALAELDSDRPLHRALPTRPSRAAPAQPWKSGGFGIGFPSLLDHLGSLVQDVRYGFRGLRYRPLFTVAALLTLTLGIGANSALFSIVYGVLLRPLPWADAEQLVTIWRSVPDNPTMPGPLTDDEFVRVAELEMLAGAAAYGDRQVRVIVGDATARLDAAAVTPGFSELLGLRPEHGRWLADAPEGPEIVLSHHTATQLFGEPEAAVGAVLAVEGEPHVVTGVLADADSLPPQSAAWLLRAPVSFQGATMSFASLHVLARVASSSDRESLEAALDAVVAAVSPEAREQGTRYAVESLQENMVGQVRPVLVRFALGVGLVLLIACANVANLLLEQSAARRGERAVRRALGASRTRLVRQSLVESLMLGGMGSFLGVALAWGSIQLFIAVNPLTLPRIDEIRVDLPVLAFTLAIGLCTGLIFGLAPAIRAGRGSLRGVLGESVAGSPSGWGGRALAVLELAMSLTLLIGAALLVHSFAKMALVDPGYDADQLLSARLELGGMDDAATTNQAVAEAIERLEAIPGIEAVSFTESAPPGAPPMDREVMIEGQPLGAGDTRPRSRAITVGARYFDALGLRFLEGVAFTAADVADERRRVVVNEVFARRYLDGGPRLGRRLLLGGRLWEIVGVVADARIGDIRDEPAPTLYQPGQRPVSSMTMGGQTVRFGIASWLVMRASGDVERAAAQVRDVARSLPPAVRIARLDLVTDRVWDSLAAPRFLAAAFGAFALSGALLAAIGVYAVMAYSVSRRTYELGVRMVLGATRRRIVRGVMVEGAATIVAGVVIGTAAALALSRYIGTFLYGVEGTDVLTYALVAALLATVAAVATYLPARRAVSIDPVEALRQSSR